MQLLAKREISLICGGGRCWCYTSKYLIGSQQRSSIVQQVVTCKAPQILNPGNLDPWIGEVTHIGQTSSQDECETRCCTTAKYGCWSWAWDNYVTYRVSGDCRK